MDTANKEARKRKATSRLEESTEALTKKLKEAQNRRQYVPSASETSAPSRLSTPLTTQPGTPSENVENDDDDNINNNPIELISDDNNDPTENGDGVEGDSVEKGSVNTQEALGEANYTSCEHQLISIIDKLYKTYKSPIYVFYLPPVFKVENGKRYQVFRCAAKQCFTLGGHVIKRNMDTTDATSTSNLKAHAKKCFGDEAVAAASGVRNLRVARDVMKDKINLKRSGSLAVAFERAGQQRVTYSTKPPTPVEVRANHVLWMCESKRAFELVKDRGYHLNMKSGRPQQYIPSPTTVSRDVREVFLVGRKLVAKVLRVCCVQNHA